MYTFLWITGFVSILCFMCFMCFMFYKPKDILTKFKGEETKQDKLIKELVSRIYLNLENFELVNDKKDYKEYFYHDENGLTYGISYSTYLMESDEYRFNICVGRRVNDSTVNGIIVPNNDIPNELKKKFIEIHGLNKTDRDRLADLYESVQKNLKNLEES